MAFREVVLTEEEMKGGGTAFWKWNAIGDQRRGVLLEVKKTRKDFGQGEKDVTLFIFKGKREDGSIGEVEVTPPYDLERKLKKAMKPVSEGGMGLETGGKHLVQMTFTSTQDIGRANPMQLFKVEVDLDPRASAAKPPPPKPPADDDIPF